MQDAPPQLVDGQLWPAHFVNFVQFFTVSDDGLMLGDNSFGCAFQQHLHIMDPQEIDQFFLQHFNWLTKSVGAATAHKDARAVLLQESWLNQRLLQMQRMPVEAPGASSSSSQHSMLQVQQCPQLQEDSEKKLCLPSSRALADMRAARAQLKGLWQPEDQCSQ